MNTKNESGKYIEQCSPNIFAMSLFFIVFCAMHGGFILHPHRQYDKWVTIWFIDANWLFFFRFFFLTAIDKLIISDPVEFHDRSFMAHLNQLPWTEPLFTRRVEQTVLTGKHMTFCRVSNESISVVSAIQSESPTPHFTKEYFILYFHQFRCSFSFLNRRLKSFDIQILQR